MTSAEQKLPVGSLAIGNYSWLGGNDPSIDGAWRYEQDPWVRGMKVFDVTALEWTEKYDASAEPYEPPAMIQQHYREK